MRCEVFAPGHVVLRRGRALRWLLLAAAAVLSVVTIGFWIQLDYPAPLVVGVAFSALLLVGAVIAVCSHDEIEIDTRALRWSRRRVIGGGEVVVGRAAIADVVLRGTIVTVRSQHSTRRRMRYHVGLRCRDADLPELIDLRSHDREPAARRFAERVSAGARLPLFDALGEVGELRAHDALDGPPPGRTTSPDDAMPPGLELEPDPIHGATAVCRLLPPAGRRLLPVVAFASLCTSALGGLVMASGSSPTMAAVVWAALGFGELILLGALSWWGFARCRVWVADGELHCAVCCLGLTLRRRRLPVDAIERVRVQSREGQTAHLDVGVAAVADRGTILCGQGLDAGGRRWLRAWLEARLWPALPAAGPEAMLAPPQPEPTCTHS